MERIVRSTYFFANIYLIIPCNLYLDDSDESKNRTLSILPKMMPVKMCSPGRFKEPIQLLSTLYCYISVNKKKIFLCQRNML